MVTTLVTANYKGFHQSATWGADGVAEPQNHFLSTDLPVSLNIPVAQCSNCGSNRLRKVEVRVLQEAKRELVVLTDRYQCNVGVEGLQLGS
jgi:hypothetical protein